jgi:hypothetical protein
MDYTSLISLKELALFNRIIVKFLIKNLEVKTYRRTPITRAQIITAIRIPIKHVLLLIIFSLNTEEAISAPKLIVMKYTNPLKQSMIAKQNRKIYLLFVLQFDSNSEQANSLCLITT